MTKQNTQTTKELILEAAQKVFHKSGLKGARTTEIAKEAGMSRTMLHYHFSTKEALYQAVLAKTLGDIVPYLSRLIEEEKDLWKIIRNMIDTVSDLLEDNPGLPHFLNTLITESPEIFQKSPILQEVELPLMLIKPLERAKQTGLIRQEILSEDLAMNILSLCSYPYLTYNFIQYKENRTNEEMSTTIRARRDSIYELIVNGIKNHDL